MHDPNSVCFVYEKKRIITYLPLSPSFNVVVTQHLLFEGMLIHLNPFQMSIFHHYHEVDFYHQTQWDG